jgi:hypothetical protein
MTILEEILAFLFVMGIVSIPIVAILTRKNSAIGQAWADRIRMRSERRFGRLLASRRRASEALLYGHNDGGQPGRPPDTNTSSADGSPGAGSATDRAFAHQQEIIDAQQVEIGELSTKIEFLQKLIEDKQRDDAAHN